MSDAYRIWMMSMREIHVEEPHITRFKAHIKAMDEMLKLQQEMEENPIIMQPEEKSWWQKFIWLFR